MGSIANRIIQKEEDYDSRNWTAQAKFTMTPGVNGDYGHPKAYFKAQTFKKSDNFAMMSYDVELSGTDLLNTTGEYEKHNEANLTLQQVVNISLPETMTSAEAILNGYEVDMKCVDEKESECNSNGIWPFNFEIKVERQPINSNVISQFLVTVHIDRGWTPSHGGGKALNAKM